MSTRHSIQSLFGSPSDRSPTRRAAALLADRLQDSWSVERLASAVGLSCRTLHRVVRRELGVSPMMLLRHVRLAQARADLETPGRNTSVTNVASDCGFNHLGRFARDYARRFGESPSETLQRARGRRAEPARDVTGAAGTASWAF